MSYKGIFSISTSQTYANDIYFQVAVGGNPPPVPRDRFLLQENGQFLLQENGQKINIEVGTPE